MYEDDDYGGIFKAMLIAMPFGIMFWAFVLWIVFRG